MQTEQMAYGATPQDQDPNQAGQEQQRLAALLGPGYPRTDLNVADEATQRMLGRLNEVVSDERRTTLTQGSKTVIDPRVTGTIGGLDPLADGRNRFECVAAATQGPDALSVVWRINEPNSPSWYLLASPAFSLRPSEASLYGTDANGQRTVSGGVVLGRNPSVVGRKPKVPDSTHEQVPNNESLGITEENRGASRRQSEWRVDENGIIHVKNLGMNEMVVLRAPSSEPSSRSQTSSANITRPTQEAVVMDPEAQVKNETWKVAVEALRVRRDAYRATLEERLRADVASHRVIEDSEEYQRRMQVNEAAVARGVPGYQHYNGNEGSDYYREQLYYDTMDADGNLVRDYIQVQPEDQGIRITGRPVTPGRYIQLANPNVRT